MYKIDDRAWIREDTLTMLLPNARLKHLQKTHMGMKWYKSDGAMGCQEMSEYKATLTIHKYNTMIEDGQRI